MGREEATEPILGQSTFVPSSTFSAHRPRRDSLWTVLFVLCMTAAAAGGLYAYVHKNPDFATLASPDYLVDPAHCPAAPAHAAAAGGRGAGDPRTRRVLLSDGDAGKEFADPTLFLRALGACTALSVVGGLALGLVGLGLTARFPHATVGAAVGLQVAIPAAAGVAILAAGGGGGAAPMFMAAGLLALTFYLYRQQLALVGRLLGVAGAALWDNAAAIVGGSLLLQAGGVLLVLPLGLGIALAFANGGVALNPSVASIQPSLAGASAAAAAGPAVCLDAAGRQVMCCTWAPDGWALGYIAATALLASWCVLLGFTLKTFVVASVTAQWYFAPAANTSSYSSTTSSTPSPLGTALRHALGPSFGSLALAAWLLNLLSLLKQSANALRSSAQDGQGGGNLLAAVAASCFDFLLSLLEAVTKFAVVACAVTGDALLPSCRATAALLARNLLDSVGVWFLPGMVLQVTALLLAGVWGGAVGAGSYVAWGRSKEALSSGVALGLVAFVSGLLVLAYVSSVLLSVVDAVYICFALDRDAGRVSRPQVHAVYVLLPANKAPMGVVEQPDGGYAFGAPVGQAPPYYQQPQQQQQQQAFYPPAPGVMLPPARQ